MTEVSARAVTDHHRDDGTGETPRRLDAGADTGQSGTPRGRRRPRTRSLVRLPGKTAEADVITVRQLQLTERPTALAARFAVPFIDVRIIDRFEGRVFTTIRTLVSIHVLYRAFRKPRAARNTFNPHSENSEHEREPHEQRHQEPNRKRRGQRRASQRRARNRGRRGKSSRPSTNDGESLKRGTLRLIAAISGVKQKAVAYILGFPREPLFTPHSEADNSTFRTSRKGDHEAPPKRSAALPRATERRGTLGSARCDVPGHKAGRREPGEFG